MDQRTYQMHISAGRAYGQEATCGNKIDYGSEFRADKAAAAMMQKGAKRLEAYPCVWCHGWHIGREMTVQEKLAWSE